MRTTPVEEPSSHTPEARRHHAEVDALRESLRAARERYVDLFEFAPVAYLVTDARGTILEANRAAGELLNVPERSLVGEPITHFMADRRAFRRRLGELNRSGAAEQWELVVVPRARERLHVEIAVRRALEAGVEYGELRWMLRAVERRWQAEQELRALYVELERRVQSRTREIEQERARLQAVIEQIPAGLVIADASSGRVVLANTQASAMLGSVPLGLDLEESLGKAYREDGSPYEPDSRPLARSITTGEVVNGEIVEIELVGGERRLLEVNSGPIRAGDGEIAAGVLVFQDITERARRERAQRDFVTNAAHELQTPLAAITSAIEVLQAGAKESPAERDRFLGHAERECGRLRRLARALLVLARAQIGAEPPRAELVELRPLLDDVAAALSPGATRVDVSCADDVAVLANRDLLEQAVANLGANAVKYAGAERVRLAAGFGDGRVAVEVYDGGPGIPADERERVFERFYQGRDAADDGFGLGLAIVAAAVRALEGELELQSDEAGTRIAIKLPSARLVS